MELQSYLPYLVNRAGHRFAAEFAPVLQGTGIDVAMWRVLAALSENGARPVGALSQLVSINLSTLSRLLGRMERKRLVERSRGGSDARTVMVNLTSQGRETLDALLPEALALERRATADFSRSELASLRELLTRLYANQCTAQDTADPPGRRADF